MAFCLKALHNASKLEIQDLEALAGYRQATPQEEEAQIPKPELFSFLQLSPRNTPNTRPSLAQCATHLELLEVFFGLRLRILQSPELDTAFGIMQDHETVYRYDSAHPQRQPVQLADPNWDEKRRAKWPIFLSIAAARFDMWARNSNETVTETDARSRLQHLPPLDIVMVWHAFLLNPKSYQEYCSNLNLKKLQKLPFPWPDVHNAINSREWTFRYTLPPDASSFYRQTFNLEPDLFQSLVETSKLDPGSRIPQSLFRLAIKVAARLGTNARGTHPPLNTVELVDGSASGSTLSLLSLLRPIPCPFTITLANNVERQASFVDKMHRQLWIRSPFVSGTLSRAISRYEKFLSLFQLYPTTMFVPTLDIDLVWHTHQLSAEVYEKGAREVTGKFINHDDTITKTTLSDGMERTAGMWRVRFGEDYEGCFCWDCEGVKDVLGEEEEGGGEKDDDHWGNVGEDLIERVQKEVEYYRSVEVARRKGWERLPVRDSEG
ncbi:hypothetical protein QBC42DRAFT_344777 [Cladorrhinum samala]|uniref:Uncharacterized protein n=1 Tax=Cladorrhinum samala TaxID=585594 RepID=A0AAV9HUH5_9PEZI|nr:hypothetical protein QBC42DRAFT_344777 [Cladorrhinum samala]